MLAFFLVDAAVLKNAGIIRNRLKVRSTLENARAMLRIRERPIQNSWVTWPDVLARTQTSDAMSAALKKMGFRFFGSTIC